MTLSEERCPTCDGSGVVSRGDQRFACPTCSPTTNGRGPYLTPADFHDQSNALRIVRWAAYLVGAVAFLAVLALMIRALWK